MAEDSKPQQEAPTKAPDPTQPDTGTPADTGQADYGSAGEQALEDEEPGGD